MTATPTKTAVVTGASSGIGAATALRLAREGFSLVVGARRSDPLEEIARACDARAFELDVRDIPSVQRFCDAIERVDVLVNNAGLASGLERFESLSDERVANMLETNVLGVIRVTRALLSKLEASGGGHIVNVGSIAAFEVYPGGAGYTASKHALRALTRTLRVELLGRPVRVTEVLPGHVNTEFALVRFDADADRAAKVYQGFTPLSAEDVADCIAWAVTRPAHVNIDEILVRPVAQASATQIARSDPDQDEI